MGHYDEGGVAAAPIWGDFMHHALEGRPVIDFPVPSGVTVASLNEGEDRPRKHRAPRPRIARRRELSPECRRAARRRRSLTPRQTRQYGDCAARTRSSTGSARRASPVSGSYRRLSPRNAPMSASTPSTMASRS